MAAWLVFRPRLHSGGAGPGGDAASMSPETAYLTAVRLSRAGHHGESIPYYRQALRAGSEHWPSVWLAHFNYGAALYNVGLEVREHRGVPVPVIRSSIERVALMRDALAQLDLAEQMAPTAADRATVMRARADRFRLWGFPWEGFVLLRRAQWADPGNRELLRLGDAAQRALEHPDQQPKAVADSTARR